MKKVIKLWNAWRYHQRANWAADKLRMHNDADLKDIGITRNDIQRMAHDKCPWCDGKA